ncbi:DNA-binding domain-containing protein [Leptospira idonii]|uniref:DUF2063 domain-containing protein n=1 Tax=Leptospira idonii TaxID=1193500 RepID=A0A4R9M3Y1_9LEPT|nr:DNA-binding domain-containing protein [Leptospira idonii]TGN20681.1 DUF2063 domain-containing protein [Leptospira idonii]
MTPLSKIQSSYFLSVRTGEHSELLRLLSGAAGKLSKEEAVQVYEDAYLYRFAEVLSEKFPAVRNVLGEEDFFSLAREYISRTPSFCYDISRYGENFPQFISEVYPKYPILSDLAKLESELDLLFRKKQHIPYVWSDHYESNDLESAIFSFGESLSLISFEHSVLGIWEKRNTDESFDVEFLSEKENLLIYKKREELFIRRLDEDEFLFLDHLRKGNSVGDTLSLLESVLQLDERRVGEWFFALAEMEIVSSVEIRNTP